MRRTSITYRGLTLPIKEWASKAGISRRLLAYRLANGWTVERAITQSATNGNNQFMVY